MPRTTLLAALALLLAAAPTAAAKPGDVDRRFGNKGVATTRILDGGFAGLVQRDGRILVAGGIANPGVMRLTARGKRSRTFGRNGIAVARRYGLPFGIRRVGGTIRVAVGTTASHRPPVELLRFGRRGKPLPPAIHTEHVEGPLGGRTMRPDGGAYVTGFDGIRAIAPDGSTDTRFAGGTLAPGELPGFRGLYPAAVRADGRVLLVGRRRGRSYALQVTPDGALDPAFGSGGAARLPFDANLVIGRRGGIIGFASRGRYPARVFRLTARGVRRRAFGVGGVAGTWRGSRYSYGTDAVEDARGRIYVLTTTGSSRRLRVVALTRSGRALRRFGRRGSAYLPRARRGWSLEGEDLMLDRRRGLIVVGTRYHGEFPAHPERDGCGDIREDFCAYEQLAAVWRMKR